MMKNYSLLFCFLLFLSSIAGGKAGGAGYAQTFSGSSLSGDSYTFRDYVENLNDLGFNDVISSVRLTGLWIFYENNHYNKYNFGNVYWFHGVDSAFNFTPPYSRMTSSLKYGGNRHYLNEDSFTLYNGSYFTGDEFYGNINTPDLTGIRGQRSLVLTGNSAWTFFTGYSYTGRAYCVYQSTDRDQGADGTFLKFGIFPTFSSIGLPENSFLSAAKGCYSQGSIVRPEVRTRNSNSGAWGFVDMARNNP